MEGRYFTIFASMRTGSNLLERTLGSYAGLRAEGELFNARFIGQPGRTTHLGRCLTGRDEDPAGFLADVIRDAAPDIPGFRLFDGHAPKMLAHAARDPAAVKIILTRNPVDSFISLKIAARTGQWMLRNAERRKGCKVRFIANDFESYRAGLEAHYARLRAMIAEAGQAAAEIAYDQLGDVATLNRLAAMIGSPECKPALAPGILRQNPADWADKVENVDELMAHVAARPELAQTGGPAGSPLDHMVAARGVEAIFAAAPGAGDAAVTDLLARLGGGAVTRGLKPVHVARRRKRGAFVFSFVRHPATRLLSVFAARMTPDDPLPRVLIRDHGAPAAPGQTAAGFDAFLDFIEASRAGRAALPPAPDWEAQAALIDRYQSIAPLEFIGRVERMAEDGAAVIRRLNGDGAAPPEAPAAPVAPWFDRGREERLRRLYAEDYERFGYDWLTA